MQYNIQLWASRHIFLARILLIILHTILGYAAYFTALRVSDDLEIPLSLVFVPLLISILLLLQYKEKEAAKIVPPTLVLLRMLFWFFVGIQLSHFADEKPLTIENNYAHFTARKANSEQAVQILTVPANKFLSAWKKLIQRDKRMVKLDPEPDTSLIVLGAILGVIAIVLLTLYLSCSLACCGAESLALLVILLGAVSIAGVIYLAISRTEEIRADFRKKERKRLREQPKPNQEEVLPQIMPKKDTPPTITQKIEVPKAQPTPKKKTTPKERRYEKHLDKGIIWAKILTLIVLSGLIIFTIRS